MKKSLLTFTFTVLLSHSLYAVDTYKLTYTKDTNCTLTKNAQEVPLFDKRFKSKAPKNGYRCFAIQKEQYNECHIVKKNNITALVFSYGVYDYTNMITAFQIPTKYSDASVEIECTKSLNEKK